MNEETKSIIKYTTSSATRSLRKAIKNHNKLVKHHRALRLQYLQQLADDLNEREDTPGKIQVEDLIKREQKRQYFAIISNDLKQRKSKGITMIEVPSTTTPGRWELISEP
jgi:hypothetical protein